MHNIPFDFNSEEMSDSEMDDNISVEEDPVVTSHASEFWSDHLGPKKTNASLLEFQCKKKLRVKKDSVVVDLTTGEGKFWSDELKESVTPYFFDKYKNKDNFPRQYSDVESYSRLSSLEGKADVVFHDPPYCAVGGGHRLNNCDWNKSFSRIKFNFAYGVDYPYTKEMIHHMYFCGFERAKMLLKDGGFFLVKCMNFKDNP